MGVAGRLDLVVAYDRQAVDRRADLVRIAIEQRNEADALAAEPLVARDRLAEVADADECDSPLLGEAEDGLDLRQQLLDVVADPLLAELAEVG